MENLNQEQVNLNKNQGQPNLQQPQPFSQQPQMNTQQPQQNPQQQNMYQNPVQSANQGFGQAGQGFEYNPYAAQQFAPNQGQQGFNQNGVNVGYTYGMGIKDVMTRVSTIGMNGTLSWQQMITGFKFNNLSNLFNCQGPDFDSSRLHNNFTNYCSASFYLSIISVVISLAETTLKGGAIVGVLSVVGAIIGLGIAMLLEALFVTLSEQNPIKWKTWVPKVLAVLAIITVIFTGISTIVDLFGLLRFRVWRLIELLKDIVSLCAPVMLLSVLTLNFEGMNPVNQFNQNGFQQNFNQQPQNFQQAQQFNGQQQNQQFTQQSQQFQQAQQFNGQQQFNQPQQNQQFNGQPPHGF